MGTYEEFVDLARERFPSEDPARLEEAAKHLAESEDISFEMETLSGEEIQ